MGQRSDEIRDEIERTRSDLSTSLDVLGDRVSPRKAARRSVSDARGRLVSARERVMGAPDAGGMRGTMSNARGEAAGLRDRAGEAAGNVAGQMRDAPDMIRENVEGNPLAAGLIAFGAGLLLGSLIPPTEAERRMASTVADEIQPAVEQAQSAVAEIKSEMQDSAREAADQLKDDAKSAVDDIKDQAKGAADEVKEQAKGSAEEMKGEAQGAAQQTASSARQSS